MAQETSRDTAAINELMEKKLRVLAQIQELQTQVAHINIELQRVGAESADLICW
jgi:hypothetical protein